MAPSAPSSTAGAAEPQAASAVNAAGLGRDPRNSTAGPPTEEWGGIAYALAGMDAALDDGWEIVPLIRVGRDLAPQAADFALALTRLRRQRGASRFRR